ncbi:hypothetical protein [Pseudonocardia sp. DLS-67]
MQLPLSASALVMLGVGAVLVGASILVVEIARRRKSASGPTRVPPDMRMPQQPAPHPGPFGAAPVGAPVAAPLNAAPHVGPVAPVPAAETMPGPAAPPIPQPQPLAGPVAAAATPRPMEVSAHVDPPREPAAEVPPARTPPAGLSPVPQPQRHYQAGSGKTVAEAVAQAFAVRAAASRGSTAQRPVNPPPPDGAVPVVQESIPEPPVAEERVETGAPVEADPALDGVDPAATTDPDGRGLTAVPSAGPAETPEVVAAPEAVGDVWAAATTAQGTNGDRPADAAAPGPEGNGRPPESWQPSPEPAPDGDGPATPTAGWTPPHVPEPAEQPEPEAALVPAPRPDGDGPSPDARDRLLAVLLDDPERAVGATVELESCLRELDRLSDAVRTGRAALRDVLHRLASAGLRPEQLSRLARLPQPEIEELLAHAGQEA